MWSRFRGLAIAVAVPVLVTLAMSGTGCRRGVEEARNVAETRPLEPSHGRSGDGPRRGRAPAKRKAQPQQGDDRGAPAEEPTREAPADHRIPPPRLPDASEKAVA